jgi:glycerate dehydrogenase
VEFHDRVFGIVGLGRIGRATARAALGLGMRVVADARGGVPDPVQGIERLDLDDVFRQADVLSLHCPLTPETENLVNARSLALMKASAFLINTSRGGLVDEVALAEALNAERLAGAGLDVVCKEPPSSGSPLFGAKNCFVTPHVAWSTLAARERLLSVAIKNLERFLAGSAANVVG